MAPDIIDQECTVHLLKIRESDKDRGRDCVKDRPDFHREKNERVI